MSAAGGYAKFEDLRRLQTQLDQMKARLDFLAPVLPTVNLVQDYFQKVECEASVQMMRLRNSPVVSSLFQEDDCDLNIEMVKWLNTVTDATMALGAKTASQPASQAASTPLLSPHSSTSPRSSASPSAFESALKHQKARVHKHSSPRQPTPECLPLRPSPRETVPSHGERLVKPASARSGQKIVCPRIPALGSGDSGERDVPLGLKLGRGDWADAYREARGRRREAMQLLFLSDSVSSLELSDDRTVISQEHIDECVSIAMEMLDVSTLEMWSRDAGEAKRIFEAKLTTLYQRRFGETT